MASLTQRTWVWASSGSQWWTGKPGMLQSMGLQRVRHGWATALIPIQGSRGAEPKWAWFQKRYRPAALLQWPGGNMQPFICTWPEEVWFPCCPSYLLKVKVLVAQSCLSLSTPWTVASQAPLSMGFSRQESWSGLSCLIRMIFKNWICSANISISSMDALLWKGIIHQMYISRFKKHFPSLPLL